MYYTGDLGHSFKKNPVTFKLVFFALLFQQYRNFSLYEIVAASIFKKISNFL